MANQYTARELHRRKQDKYKSWTIAALAMLLGTASVSSWTFAFKVWEAARRVHEEASIAKIEASAAKIEAQRAQNNAINNRVVQCFIIDQLLANNIIHHDHPLCDDLDLQPARPARKIAPPTPEKVEPDREPMPVK